MITYMILTKFEALDK